MELLKNKKILITGLLNKRSIAFFVLKKCVENGAKVGITCQNDYIKNKNIKLLNKENILYDFIEVLDVSEKESFEQLHEKIKLKWDKIDGLLFSIAYAPIDSFNKKFLELKDSEISSAINLSASSYLNLIQSLKDLFKEGTSLVSLSFDTDLYVPNYNAMAPAKKVLETISLYLAEDLGSNGIRINTIRSGPIKTISSSIIPKPKGFYEGIINNSMLKKELTGEDVANTSLFLLSDLSSKITGEIISVDCGLSKKRILNN